MSYERRLYKSIVFQRRNGVKIIGLGRGGDDKEVLGGKPAIVRLSKVLGTPYLGGIGYKCSLAKWSHPILQDRHSTRSRLNQRVKGALGVTLKFNINCDCAGSSGI